MGKRLKTLLVKVLCHQDFKGRPWIRIAHWLVMVSFPILFFTLVTGYAQIFSPDWALPLIGHFPPWEWLVEFIALASTIAIIGLIVVRSVNTAHGRKSPFYRLNPLAGAVCGGHYCGRSGLRRFAARGRIGLA